MFYHYPKRLSERLKMINGTMRYTDFLLIEPKKSIQLLVILFFSHLIIMLLVLVFVQYHWFIQFVILMLVGFSWVYYYRLHSTKMLNKSVLAAYHQQDKGWLIRVFPNNDEKNMDIAVVLSGASYVSQWWVILNFYYADNNSRYTLLVPIDSVSAEVHRQLRVRLKIMS